MRSGFGARRGPRAGAGARAGLWAAALAVLLAGSTAQGSRASVAGDPGRRAREILADARFQTAAPRAEKPRGDVPPGSVPLFEVPGGASSGAGGAGSRGRGAGARAGDADAGVGGAEARAGGASPLDAAGSAALAGSAAASAVLYGTAALAFALLVIALVRAVAARRRRPPPPAPAAVEAGPGGSAGEGRPAGAEQLAGEGRYGEAVHALLLVAIEQVGRRTAHGPPASWTSRELVGRLPLRESSRAAFAELVEAVEGILFGGIAAGAADYERGLRLLAQVIGPAQATAAPGGTPP